MAKGFTAGRLRGGDLENPASRSRGSGSLVEGSLEGDIGLCVGLETGETRGDVCRPSGTCPDVSKMKKASPPSPSFIA